MSFDKINYTNRTDQANHVGKDVLVGEYLRLLCLRQLLQVGVCLVQQQVNQVAEQLLEEDGEDQSEPELLLYEGS